MGSLRQLWISGGWFQQVLAVLGITWWLNTRTVYRSIRRRHSFAEMGHHHYNYWIRISSLTYSLYWIENERDAIHPWIFQFNSSRKQIPSGAPLEIDFWSVNAHLAFALIKYTYMTFAGIVILSFASYLLIFWLCIMSRVAPCNQCHYVTVKSSHISYTLTLNPSLNRR